MAATALVCDGRWAGVASVEAEEVGVVELLNARCRMALIRPELVPEFAESLGQEMLAPELQESSTFAGGARHSTGCTLPLGVKISVKLLKERRRTVKLEPELLPELVVLSPSEASPEMDGCPCALIGDGGHSSVREVPMGVKISVKLLKERRRVIKLFVLVLRVMSESELDASSCIFTGAPGQSSERVLAMEVKIPPKLLNERRPTAVLLLEFDTTLSLLSSPCGASAREQAAATSCTFTGEDEQSGAIAVTMGANLIAILLNEVTLPKERRRVALDTMLSLRTKPSLELRLIFPTKSALEPDGGSCSFTGEDGVSNVCVHTLGVKT